MLYTAHWATADSLSSKPDSLESKVRHAVTSERKLFHLKLLPANDRDKRQATFPSHNTRSNIRCAHLSTNRSMAIVSGLCCRSKEEPRQRVHTKDTNRRERKVTCVGGVHPASLGRLLCFAVWVALKQRTASRLPTNFRIEGRDQNIIALPSRNAPNSFFVGLTFIEK